MDIYQFSCAGIIAVTSMITNKIGFDQEIFPGWSIASFVRSGEN
jgi:hypothetical protein